MKVFNNLKSRNLPKDKEYYLDRALGDLLHYRKSQVGTETYWRNHPEIRTESGLIKELLKDDIFSFWYLYELCCIRDNQIAKSLAEDSYACDKNNHVPQHEARETYEAILEWNDYVDLVSLREELGITKELIEYHIAIDKDEVLHAIAIGDKQMIQSLLLTSRSFMINATYKAEMEKALSSALELPQPSPKRKYKNPLLSSSDAQELLNRLVTHGFFINQNEKNEETCTVYQQVHAAHCISNILWNENKWIPFEDLWGLKNMRVVYENMTGRIREVSQESLDMIEDLFPEYERIST